MQIFEFAIAHFRRIFQNDAQGYGLVITTHMKAWVPYYNMVVLPYVAYFLDNSTIFSPFAQTALTHSLKILSLILAMTSSRDT